MGRSALIDTADAAADSRFDLDERAQRVLKMIVSEYIKEGEPVGSRTLSKISDLNLSSASIRNVMSDLEEIGLLTNVHTSSGRIPTSKGLRFYINSLAAFRRPTQSMINDLRENLNVETSSTLIDSANRAVSRITTFASLIAIPNSPDLKIRKLQFLKLSERRLLLVVVTSDGKVTNSVLAPDEDYEESDLTATANYFNRHLRDKTFAEASELLSSQMERLYKKISRSVALLQTALEQARTKHDSEGDVHITGTENLLRLREQIGEMDKLRGLLETLETRKGFRRLLETCQSAQEVQIFIGNECGFDAFNDLSMISLRLSSHERPLGMIGVIGPKWMKYDRVIPLVKVTAQVVGDSLDQIRSELE